MNRTALSLDVRKDCAFPPFLSDVLRLCPEVWGGAPQKDTLASSQRLPAHRPGGAAIGCCRVHRMMRHRNYEPQYLVKVLSETSPSPTKISSVRR
jgi:hypothetical protein